MNHIPSLEEQDPPKQDSELLNTFLKKLEEISSPEEKLRAAISFMREALSQSGTPYFKGFWEIRRLCLPLFKEEIPGPVRSSLWDEYTELTREGRRLKNLLDEESAFAMEQIDIAIKSLEEEVNNYHTKPEEIFSKTVQIEFPGETQVLEDNILQYQEWQRRLNLLNAYASRINALRKELIKTEMRIRQKNKFFERLSTLGDQVFPTRKDLIKEVSENFMQDINAFVEAYFAPDIFNHEKIRKSVFAFREEIKTLQAIAKLLTLNTHAFTKTREQLSECWDKLKGMEKELKKEYSQQRHKSAENTEHVRQRIQEVTAAYQEGKYTVPEALKHYDEVLRWMRDVELTRVDVKALKDEIQLSKEPLQKVLDNEEDERRQKEREFEQKKRAQIDELRERIEKLKEEINVISIDQLTIEIEAAKQALGSMSMTKGERQMMERSLKAIREQIEEKKERALLDLSDDDRAALDQLRVLLDQRKVRRSEIKLQLEEYRKILGGSSLDFERAIEYNELMSTEKERLEKNDESIREIEQKIQALKSKV